MKNPRVEIWAPGCEGVEGVRRESGCVPHLFPGQGSGGEELRRQMARAGGTVPPPRGRPCGRSPERLRRGRARSQHGTPRVPKTRFKLS